MTKTPRARQIIVLLACLAACMSQGASVTWSGASGIDTNWSNGVNWTGLAFPGAGDDVKLFDTGAVATVSNVNNVVDGSFAGTIASLQFGNTNNSHTTLIPPGVTLNITGAGGLSAATPVDPGSVKLITNTITGAGGSLSLNNAAADLIVCQGTTTANGSKGLLDMSGLDNLTVNLKGIGLGSTLFPSPGGQRLSGTLYLAKTNTITLAQAAALSTYMISGGQLPAISISHNAGNNSAVASTLYLGRSNAFFIDSITIGGIKAATTTPGLMLFNPAFTNNNPAAYFRGTNSAGTGRIKWWSIGDMGAGASTGSTATGTNDFSNGAVDALIDTLSLGRDPVASHTASGNNAGMLTFNAGIIDVNTVFVGNQGLGTATASTVPEIGIINVIGANAVLRVNGTMTLANTITASAAATNSFGKLNLTNGTAYVSNIVVGANSSSANNAINLTNATLIVSNAIATSGKPLTNVFTANSTLGLTITTNGAAKAFIGTLISAGATNLIRLASTPPVFFSSYPQQFALIKYAVWNGPNNLGLSNAPAWAPGASLESNNAAKSIDLVLPSDPRPVITGQPSAYSGNPGDDVTTNFVVSISGGSVGPLAYQWYYYTNGGPTNLLSDGTGAGGGSTLAGSTTAAMTINSAQVADSGNYFAVVTNVYGTATSSVAVLTISSGSAPIITGPNNQTVIQGNNANFSATVSANPAAAVQWRRGGTNIPGASTLSLTVSNAQYPADDQAVFSIIASNSFGSVTNSAVLSVIVPPVISVQPASLTVTNTQAAALTVSSTNGVPAPAYQWYKNSLINPIANATNSTLSFASASPADIATYFVVISNPAGSATSSNATLTVNSTMAAVSLSPSNAASGVCFDTPLYITFDLAPLARNAGTIKIFNSTNTVTPVDILDLSLNVTYMQPGTGIPSYPVSVQPRTIAGATYTNFPVIISSNTAAIYPHLGVMTSNQTYFVTIDSGVFTDTNGAWFAGISSTNTWRFATKPAGPVGTNFVVVAADGGGDFCTVQGAVDFLPNASTNRVIFIRKGVCQEIVNIPAGKNNITLRGEDRQQSQLKYPNSNIINANSHQEMVLHVRANDIAIENLKLTNSVPQGGSQAFALMIETGAKRFICNGADVDSYQDTILVNTSDSTAYFNNSLIQGDVDFIWGGGNCFFTNCEIRELRTGGILTQPRTAAGSNGMSFVSCALTRMNGTITGDLLARALNNTNGNSAFINCRVDDNITGWTAGDINNASLALRWWEYGNSNLTATAAVAFNGIQLTNNDPRLIAARDAVMWLNGWVPQLAPNIITQPTNQTINAGQTAALAVVATGIEDPAYQWLKNGTNLAGANNALLSIANAQGSDSGTYSVIVSNTAGSVTSSAVSLVVNVPTPPLFGGIAKRSDGNVQFSFSGSSGSSYRLWASTNVTLAPVTATWTLLSTGTFGASPVTFSDLQATNFPGRFYTISVP